VHIDLQKFTQGYIPSHRYALSNPPRPAARHLLMSSLKKLAENFELCSNALGLLVVAQHRLHDSPQLDRIKQCVLESHEEMSVDLVQLVIGVSSLQDRDELGLDLEAVESPVEVPSLGPLEARSS